MSFAQWGVFSFGDFKKLIRKLCVYLEETGRPIMLLQATELVYNRWFSNFK